MKNILLIVVDTLRPDRLGCYGYDRPTSPHLDALAGRGLRLDALWSASNFTAPAFTSLFTGLYPHQHGIFDFTSRALGSPLWDAVRRNGMDTGGVVTFRFFRNLLQNIWGEIEAVTDTRSFNFSKDLPFAVTAGALEWLAARRDKGRPFCLFVHYDGPHMPFRLPDDHLHVFDTVPPDQVDPFFFELLCPRADTLDNARNKSAMYNMVNAVNWGRRRLDPPTLRWVRDRYDAAVRYNDEAIGRLLTGLADLGLADETVVAVLSDHGEEHLEHGGFTHGGAHLYEEIIRTVGIVVDPGAGEEGTVLSHPVSQVDLLPALLQKAGAEHMPAWRAAADGGDFLAAPASNAGDAPVFCHGKSKLAVRRGPHKLIVPLPHPTLPAPARLRLWTKLLLQRKLAVEVFDLVADPGEKVNLAGRRGLRADLQGELDRHLAQRAPVASGAKVEDAERRRIEQEMKDLGYM